MLTALRRLDDDGALGLKMGVEVGIGDVGHFPVTGSIDRRPYRASPLALFLQRYDDLFPVFFDGEFEGGEEVAGVLGERGDVKNAALPIVGELDSRHVLALLREPLHDLWDGDAPLRRDTALPRKIEGEVPRHS